MAGQAHRSPPSTHAVHVELRQCQPENRSPGEPKKLTLEASSHWVLAVPEAGFMLALTLESFLELGASGLKVYSLRKHNVWSI